MYLFIELSKGHLDQRYISKVLNKPCWSKVIQKEKRREEVKVKSKDYIVRTTVF